MLDREELLQAARIATSKHLVEKHGGLDSTLLQFIEEKEENVWTCNRCPGLIVYHEIPEPLAEHAREGSPTEEELAANNEPSFADSQPPPTLPNPTENLPNITELVKLDLERRAIDGEKKYGQRLKPFNGRDALIDAYQEAIDLTLYLRQELFENYNR